MSKLDEVRNEPQWYRAGKRASVVGCGLLLLYIAIGVSLMVAIGWMTGVLGHR
ncbi:MAG: hypothetical protein KY444_06935 [Gemmatimonadetes bacterium]|nr:hypothetical protein [Gemmatimonadota bacterium]